jgi:hypothetical protein
LLTSVLLFASAVVDVPAFAGFPTVYYVLR